MAINDEEHTFDTYYGIEFFLKEFNHSSRVIPEWLDGKRELDLIAIPPELSFGQVPAGQMSEALKVIVKNNGLRRLKVMSVMKTGADFYMTGDIPYALDPNESFELSIIFIPSSSGLREGQITIVTQAGQKIIGLTGQSVWDHEEEVNVMLDGLWEFIQRSVLPALTTTGPILSLANTSIEFPYPIPQGEVSEVIDLAINNVGTQALVIDNITISGDFELQS